MGLSARCGNWLELDAGSYDEELFNHEPYINTHRESLNVLTYSGTHIDIRIQNI